jgi:hypothetical protein
MHQIDLSEAKRRGSKLLLEVALACRNELDPTAIGRVAYFLNPPSRRPGPEELFANGAEHHEAVAAEIESSFAAPTLDDLNYARIVLGRYVSSVEKEGDVGGKDAEDQPYYRRCLGYLDEVIARHQN